MENLSIGILTWKRLDILRQTLISYRDNGLLDLSDDITIFFQEMGDEEVALAKEFNIKYIGDKDNVGIKEAYKALVNKAKHPYFMFLENDWYLIEKSDVVRRRIEAGISILESGKADVVRYRHRIRPGYPCGIVRRNRRRPELTPKDDLAFVPSTTDIPEKIFDEISATEIQGEKYYFVGAKNTYWTNNPCLFKTDFVREIMDKEVKTLNPDRLIKKYNVPFKKISLEGDLGRYWKTTDHVTALSPGLFMHLDYIDDFKKHIKLPEIFLRILCWFIPNAKYRKYLRGKYSRV